MATARSIISKDLMVGHRVFDRIMENRIRQLSENARVLSMDFAFKQSIVSADYETLLSIVDNLRERVSADFASLVSLEYAVMTDTLNPALSGTPSQFQKLIEKAEEKGELSSLVAREKGYYQIVIVPILAPDPIAWLVIGFVINDAVVKDIKKLILAQISVFYSQSGSDYKIVASTLPEYLSRFLVKDMNSAGLTVGREQSLQLGQDEYISLLSPLAPLAPLQKNAPLENDTNASFSIVLQRSVDEVLQPYYRLRTKFAIITVAGLFVSIVLSLKISRSVTRPVSMLVNGVRQIEHGNYKLHINVKQQDELGELSRAFNNMAKGLEERDAVNDLLGKVVSPAIAHELLSKKVELGGEEKEVTILFSDVRNFTTLSEAHSPTMVLDLLNKYFTVMSEIVERHGGVIDKYIGDAIMALFGAPLDHPDDADRAVDAALDMSEALDRLNETFQKDGIPPINIGIGINTDIVVAGNMGSAYRHNYTVIGDGVNLASRLEGLTKNYKTRIILSESTYKKVSGSYRTQELGEVFVKGKTKPTVIYALTGRG